MFEVATVLWLVAVVAFSVTAVVIAVRRPAHAPSDLAKARRAAVQAFRASPPAGWPTYARD